MLLLASWVYHYVRTELRGCDCSRVLHCTAVNKSANLDSLWTSALSSDQHLQWSMTSSKCSIHKEHTKFVKSNNNPPSKNNIFHNSPIASDRCITPTIHITAFAGEPSLFLFSGSQYHFLSISGTARQMVFGARPRTSKEPETWGASRTESYGISNLSTRAVFFASVCQSDNLSQLIGSHRPPCRHTRQRRQSHQEGNWN